MSKISNQSFNWKGDQGNYIWKVVLDLKIPSNPTREEYKDVYDASEGDILKFQPFCLSWKNISCNLGTVNEVLQSTGAHHAAARRTKGATGPAVALVIQLASGGEWGHAMSLASYCNLRIHIPHECT